MKQIFTGEESLVNKRIIVKELSSLGTVIEDGSNCTNPYLTVRLDHASQFEKKFKLDEVVIIGEVQRNKIHKIDPLKK